MRCVIGFTINEDIYIQWWKLKAYCFPKVALLAKAALGLSALSDPCERLGAWSLSFKFGAFHPHGHRFEPHSSRHVGTLGKSFTRSCLYNAMLCPAWLPCG